METNKEIITKIIDSFKPNFCTKRLSGNNLIECWSVYRSIPDWKYYSYKDGGTISRNFNRIFSNINKPNRTSWRDYLLHISGYKYCSKCKDIHKLKNYCKDASNILGIDGHCKYCRKKYRDNNKEKSAFRSMKRHAAKLNRTPSWLTEDDLWMIKEAYSLAKEREKCTGIKWHVDHKIPLQGILVSGLHVPNNLQVITAGDNLSKSNKFLI